MDLLNRFTREELILGIVALLLALDLLVLPWWDITVGALGLSLEVTATAVQAPDAWLGVLGVVFSLALVADLLLDRLAGARLPAVNGDRATTRLALAVAAVVCIGVKFLLHVHFDYFGGGFYGAAVGAVALVVLATRARDAGRASAEPGIR